MNVTEKDYLDDDDDDGMQDYDGESHDGDVVPNAVLDQKCMLEKLK